MLSFHDFLRQNNQPVKKPPKPGVGSGGKLRSYKKWKSVWGGKYSCYVTNYNVSHTGTEAPVPEFEYTTPVKDNYQNQRSPQKKKKLRSHPSGYYDKFQKIALCNIYGIRLLTTRLKRLTKVLCFFFFFSLFFF